MILGRAGKDIYSGLQPPFLRVNGHYLSARSENGNWILMADASDNFLLLHFMLRMHRPAAHGHFQVRSEASNSEFERQYICVRNSKARNQHNGVGKINT
jgi:hypothetical protein